jgi:[ribosomal protein S5]-alanine N-acetyltransferase
LRQFHSGDLENVFNGLSRPEVIKYYGVSYPTLEAAKEQMKFFSDLEKNGTGLWWAICSKKDQSFYGAVGFSSLIVEHHKAEIGFWLLPEFWRKGILSEALPIICRFGFEQLALHRIEAIVETENTNCKNALKKLEFTHEGTLKECEFKNGKFISLDIYAKLVGATNVDNS